MSEARIQIVDEQDQPVRGATKQEAFRDGLIRRLVRGITQDESGRILLHKRAPHKTPHPNLWDWLPSGHVDEGETYDQAMRREAEEELGISANTFRLSPLETYFSSKTTGNLKLNSFSRVYKITVHSSAPIRLDESEATELRWFTVQELAQALQSDPAAFGPSVSQLFSKYFNA